MKGPIHACRERERAVAGHMKVDLNLVYVGNLIGNLK